MASERSQSSEILHSSGVGHQNFTPGDISVPHEVEEWRPMLLQSEKKSKEIKARIDADNGQVLYESKKRGIAISTASFALLPFISLIGG